MLLLVLAAIQVILALIQEKIHPVINELRSYLLNTTPNNRPSLGWYGEEYIDPDYSTIEDDGPLRTVRAVLLGTSPDALTQNYRAAQYMNLLHTSQLAANYIAKFDKRITYDFMDSQMFSLYFGAKTTLTSDNDPGDTGPQILTIAGDDDAGINYLHYRYQMAYSGTDISATIIDDTFSHTSSELTVTVDTADSSGKFITKIDTLPGSDVTYNYIGADQNAAETSVNWLIEIFNKPTRSITDIYNKLREDQGAIASLCQGGNAEPYRTFYNMFLRHPRISERLVGALLAVIYRTRDIRNGSR
jgi:hypothetical protein